MTGSVVRIGLRFWSTRILVPFMCRNARLCLTVSLLVSIITGSRCLWDLFISPHADSHIMSVITEFSVVNNVTGPIVRIGCRFWSPKVLVPFVAR